MDEQAFWAAIEQAKAGSGNNQDRQLEMMKEQLRALSLEEIGVFQRIFDAYHGRSYRVDLWRALNEIHDTGDDGFEYFRAWLISEGQTLFSEVTQCPNRLCEFIGPHDNWWFEAFWYIAQEVYEEKTGLSLWVVLKEQDKEPYSLIGWDWLRPDTIKPGDL
jgi:hypothetical protein